MIILDIFVTYCVSKLLIFSLKILSLYKMLFRFFCMSFENNPYEYKLLF